MMSYFPFVVQMIPKEYLTPQALKNQIKKKKETSKIAKVGKLAKEEGKGIRKVDSFELLKKEIGSLSKPVQPSKSVHSQKSNSSMFSLALSPSGTRVISVPTSGKMGKNASTIKCKKSENEKAVTVMMNKETGCTIDVPPEEVEQFKLLLNGKLKMEKMKMNVLDQEEKKEEDDEKLDNEVAKTGVSEVAKTGDKEQEKSDSM